MSDAALRHLATQAGLQVRWRDFRGEHRDVTPETLRALLTALELPCGSHAQVTESLDQLRTESPSPPPGEAQGGHSRAFGIDDLAPGQQLRGLAAQLYALRRDGDGGLGDFAALAALARSAGAAGADAIAISPVHSGFAAQPERFSPYAPSSRQFLNPLYADPGELPAGARELEAAPFIDWPRAAKLRWGALRARFAQLRDPAAIEAFRVFRAIGGAALEQHALFEALHAHQCAAGLPDWRAWPAALRDPHSADAAQFARNHEDEIAFHAFAQWRADHGLAAAQAAARSTGMRIGLIADLAVGVAPDGGEAWARPHDLLCGVTLGAPPDALNALGQNWNLTTFSPRALARDGGRVFREMLRASLRHAGGVRIDHVLGLRRLWLLPDGAKPTEGAYLTYPLDALLRAVIEESHRARAVIVGEDLGTVPEELRDRLRHAGVLGLAVLWFTRDHGLYVDPSRWPADVMATTTTHDLPTVAGWWQARDLDWRARLGLFAQPGDEARERAERARDRHVLWDALVHAGVARGPAPADARPVAHAAVQFALRARSRLALVPVEDLLALEEQPNLPGTLDEHPNWRRRYPAGPLPLEALTGPTHGEQTHAGAVELGA